MQSHLKQVLKERGISQVWLAKQIGVSDRQVRYWCSGERLPSIIYAVKVAETLGVEVEKIWN